MTAQELGAGNAFLVAFDLVGFSRLSDQEQLILRDRLHKTLRECFDAAGVPWDSCYKEDRGDGFFVVVGSEQPAYLLIDPLVGLLLSSIRRYNTAAAQHGQFRISMALHAGVVARDRHGIAGTDVNRLFRMLDASDVRRAARSSGTGFVLVVSEHVYHELIEGGRLALGPDDFGPIEVAVREVRAWAWLYVPEAPLATNSVASREASFVSSPSEPLLPQALPPDISGFVGRSRETARLEEINASAANGGPAVAVVQGMAGIGKTALVVHWAHQVRRQFPDGQIYIDLHGLDTSQALSRLLSALDVQAHDIPSELGAQAARYRSLIADRKILLIFDHTSSAEIVRPLLPDSSSCLSIVIVRDLALALALGQGTEIVRVGPLSDDEAVDLLGELIGSDLISTDPDAAKELARLSGYLPLALRLAATNLARYPGDRIDDAVRRLARAEAELPPGPGEGAVQANFDIVYRDLENDVQHAFRFLSLVEGLNISVETICTLLKTDANEALRLLEDLADVSFIEPAGRGEYRMHPLLLDFSRMRLLQDDAEEERQAALGRYIDALRRDYLPEASISRDYWTLDDHLSHRPYADAISAFIRHRDTRPPLTIAVKAPWGAGKTSLMRMIQDGLDPRNDGRPRDIRLTKDSRTQIGHRNASTGPASNKHVTNREILREAGERPGGLGQDSLKAEVEGNGQLAAKDWRPTVWFNPWMYQTGEQVWAGLAFEIISQVTARLPIGDRERFWLRLNLARVDSEAVRRRCYRTLIERLLPFLAIWICGLLLALCSLVAVQLVPGWRHLAESIIGSACSTGTLLFVVAAGWRSLKFFGSRVTGPLSDIVHKPDLLGRGNGTLGVVNQELKGAADKILPDPGYPTRAGFLHLVQADITKVFNLVATQERPLVIFVDDLDRCSPGTVAQVIEAINLFLAGEFPNCVFVLGMEPAAVAANVEVASRIWRAFTPKAGRLETGPLSVGAFWRSSFSSPSVSTAPRPSNGGWVLDHDLGHSHGKISIITESHCESSHAASRHAPSRRDIGG